MSYHSYCRVLFFYFILFGKSHSYNAQYSKTNSNKSEITPKHITNGKFTIFFMKNIWLNAVSYCKQNGMKIGEVKTMSDARSLTEMMLKNQPISIENAWIGGFINLTNRENNVWRWESTDEKIVNNSGLWFRQSELDSKSNSESDSKKSECLLLDWHLYNQENPAYVKATCDREREFICQKLNAPVTTTNANTSTAAKLNKLVTPTPDIISRKIVSTYITPTTEKSARKSLDNLNENKKRLKQKQKGITPHFSTSTTSTTTKTTATTAKAKTINAITTKATATKATITKATARKATTTTTTTTITPITMTTTKLITTTEEEYPDYKMWELGKKQMGSRRSQIAEETQNETPNILQEHFEYLTRMKIQELQNLMTTHKPEIKSQSTIMPLKPLRLYYAFEGPMVGGLAATPSSYDDFKGRTKVPAEPRYHKYISRQRYNELRAKKQSKQN